MYRIDKKLLSEGQNRVAKEVGEKAYSLFKSGKFLCAEAVLLVINDVFEGGLSEDMSG